MRDKRILIDLDGTLCTTTHNADYTKAKPINRNIKKANALRLKGNQIVIWTARGTTTGIDWSIETIKQLHKWGVLYDQLILGKPYYDLYIDDKCLNVEHWK